MDTLEVLRGILGEGEDLPQLRLERERQMSADEPTSAPTVNLGELATPYRRLRPGPGRSGAEVASHQLARIDRAMVEVVAERGYGRTTVREIARVAGISTRAFYEHYSGKEQCFLHVHRLLIHRLLRRVEAVAGVASWDDRISAAVDAIAEEWADDWKATRFLLIGPYGAGSTALKQLRLVDRLLGEELKRLLGYSAKESETAGLIVDGIAIGLVAAARSMMLNDRGSQWFDLKWELNYWVLSCAYPRSEAEALRAIQTRVKRDGVRSRFRSSSTTDPGMLSSGEDLALLYSAVGKLAVTGCRESLTRRLICAAAGVSRCSFDRHFSSLDDCLVAAAGQRFHLAVGCAQRAAELGTTLENRAFLGLEELCSQIACDPALASLCFSDGVESKECLVRRDRLLIGSIAELFEEVDLTSNPQEEVQIEASFGAVLGLLRNEVIAGRARRIHRIVPALTHLTLAPVIDGPMAGNAMSSPSQR